jgi:hypothetical protein
MNTVHLHIALGKKRSHCANKQFDTLKCMCHLFYKI